MKKEPIYKHTHLDLNVAKGLRKLFESNFAPELTALMESGRADLAEERLDFATKQFGNRMRVASNLGKKNPLFEDAKIFGGISDGITQLFEDFSMPYNITGSGDITNPTPTSTLTGGMWNSGAKAGSGDANTYAFGLQSHVALNCKGFDIMPLVAVDSAKVTLTYTDDIFGGGDLDSEGALPSFLDFTAKGVTNHETIIVKNKLKRGVSKVIFVSDKADGGVGFEVQFLVMSNARPFITAKVLSTGKVESGAYVAGNLTDLTVETALLTINASDKKIALLDVDGKGTALVEVPFTEELKVSNTSAQRTNLVEATSNRADGGMMSRKEHKKGVEFKINISAMDMQVEMKGRQILGDTDNLQIKDMASIGVNVIARLYNAVNNQIFQAIDTDILNHIYALGVQHAYNAYHSSGDNFNLYIGVPSSKEKSLESMGVEYKNMLGEDVAKEMGMIPNSIRSSQFENQSTHISILVARCLMVQNFIAYQNRQGTPDFLVTSKGLLSAISAHSKYTISPFNNTLTQTAQIDFTGTLNGMRVYDNNRVEFNDKRIVIGRRGTDSDAGAKFIAYDLASSVETIAEGTMSNKIVVWSRYNIADIGYYPELNYYTFVAYNDSMWA